MAQPASELTMSKTNKKDEKWTLMATIWSPWIVYNFEKHSKAFIVKSVMMLPIYLFIYLPWYTGWNGAIQPYLKSCCLVPLCRWPYKSIWLHRVRTKPKWRLNTWLIWLKVLIKVNLVKVCIGLNQLPAVIGPHLQNKSCHGYLLSRKWWCLQYMTTTSMYLLLFCVYLWVKLDTGISPKQSTRETSITVEHYPHHTMCCCMWLITAKLYR